MRHGCLSLDAFLERRAADTRLARLTHDLPLPEATGLEFGPADNPTPLPEGARVAYVDRSREAADRPGAAPVDHTWAGSEALATVLGRDGYDFAIAAQVAQYVPNLLGWLRGIHGVLRDGGVLNLSLPDKRFMFDAARPVSTLAELVEADLLDLTRPSPRQVFAHASEARAITPEQIWAGADPVAAGRLAGDWAPAHARVEAAAAAAGTYVPCHCWVFTPGTFLDLVAGASELGLFSFVLNRIAPTEPGGFEFYVSMRRDPRAAGAELRTMQRDALDHLRGAVARQRQAARMIATD